VAETFEAALQRFRSFVHKNGYASELAWLRPEQVIVRRGVLYIRLLSAKIGEESARQVFDNAAAQDRGVLFHALAGSDDLTFCHAWVSCDEDESQRYQMPKKGLKISVLVGRQHPVVHLVSSRLQWSLLRLLYGRNDVLRDLLFNIER
jgi:hypothetical protein